MFGALLHQVPRSARALYGRARSLDRIAQLEKSNSKLEQAIRVYRDVLDLAEENSQRVPLKLYREVAEVCVNRMRFRGFHGKATRIQQRLLLRFPDDVDVRNELGRSFIFMNQLDAAEEVFQTIIERWPANGFAQAHYGFVLKTNGKYEEGAKYLRLGIESQEEGTESGRFYFHLGDALARLGRKEEAYQVYDEGVSKGHFLNKYQRSLYNIDGLKSQPFWSLEETTYEHFFKKLQDNWQKIRDEGIALLSKNPQDGFVPENEGLQEKGDWKQYTLFARGRKSSANCANANFTCQLIGSFAPAAGCKRGQIKFSIMYPGTHVWAHTGPTNCRLRAHLGLVVPKDTQMRVGTREKNWEEGKVFVFDDSWEHEVWHNGSSFRLILIVDVWHPDLTDEERKSLSAM